MASPQLAKITLRGKQKIAFRFWKGLYRWWVSYYELMGLNLLSNMVPFL